MNHLVRSKHKVAALHAESQLGDITLECYNCGNKNVFVLGFISAKAESVVVILCRQPCANASGTDWDSSEWHPLIDDRAFLSWVVAVPSEREQLNARHITATEINKLETLWKTNPQANLLDVHVQAKNVSDMTPVKLRYLDGFEYLDCFLPLINMEAEYERLLREGQAQSNVTISWDIGLSNQYLASFKLSHTADSDGFRNAIGSPVKLSFEGFGPAWEDTGIVIKVPDHVQDDIVVEIRPTKSKPPIHETTNWDVKFVWQDTTFRRAKTALLDFARDETSVSSYVYHKLLGHDVDELVLDVELPKKLAAPGINDLNPSQELAVRNSLRQPLSLIQGPPGTGKTVVSTSIVYHLYQLYKEPVLVCAPSNIAVDQLAARLEKTGLKVLRVVSQYRESVSSEVDHLTLSSHVERLYMKKKSELEKLSKLKEVLGELDQKDSMRYKKLMRQAEAAVMRNPQVICCTCTTAGEFRLRNKRFRACLIDEATQATEPQCLIPIVRGCKQVILVGDHKQLGPVVMDRDAYNLGLSQSLFERLVVLRMSPTRLAIQYRMHPCLSLFPSNMFYDGCLQNGVTAANRSRPEMDFPWPDVNKPMFFWSTIGHEEISSSGTSFLNRSEAVNVEKILSKLFSMGVSPSQIGVVTPYEGQRAYIIKQLGLLGAAQNREDYQDVEVESVDAFQGREKDYIILSCVRSNHSQNIGFLGDARRMNVAITRAKYGLVITGNPRVLNKNILWSHLLAHFREKGCLLEGTLNNLRECTFPLAKPKIPMRQVAGNRERQLFDKLNKLNSMVPSEPYSETGRHAGNEFYPPLPYPNDMKMPRSDDTASQISQSTVISFEGRGGGNSSALIPGWEEISKAQRRQARGPESSRIDNAMIDRLDRFMQSIDDYDDDGLDALAEDDDDIASISSSFASKVGLYN